MQDFIKTILNAIQNRFLSKDDYCADEDMLRLLVDSVNLSPIVEDGKYLVEGNNYLIL